MRFASNPDVDYQRADYPEPVVKSKGSSCPRLTRYCGLCVCLFFCFVVWVAKYSLQQEGPGGVTIVQTVPLFTHGLGQGADFVELIQTAPLATDANLLVHKLRVWFSALSRYTFGNDPRAINLWAATFGQSADNLLVHKLSSLGYLPFATEELRHGWPVSAAEVEGIVIDVTDELDQTIIGFGGSFTEAAALVFKSLNPELQEQFLENYYGADGLGYTIGRTHINSCDFSPNSWSFDNESDDFNLTYFDHDVTHDQAAMLPLIKRVQATVAEAGSELKLLASPWSPPAWMKRSGKMGGSTTPGLRDDCKLVWAEYIAAWISAYKAQGVPLWGLTPQNEPTKHFAWESCLFSPQESADWVGAYLGPVMKKAHPEVNIFAYDDNRDYVYEWAKTFYNHPTAGSYIAGIAFHWYAQVGFANVERAHTEFPQAVLLATEAASHQARWTPGATVETGSVNVGEGYAHDILGDLNAGATGWTDWNLIVDQEGGPSHVGNKCDAPMQADVAKQEVYIHPHYWYMGHFSKYIKPGSRRMVTKVTGSRSYAGGPRLYGTCTGDDGLQATAFLLPDDAGFALVVLNCGDEAIDFSVRLKGRTVRSSIPAHGIQTYRGAVPVDRPPTRGTATHGAAGPGGHAGRAA